MGEEEVKQSPSTIRPKLEQIQRRSSPRKRKAPKVEESEDVLVDVVEEPPPKLTLAAIKQNESLQPQEEQEEEEELIEFTKGVTNKGATCIWHNGYRYHKHYGTYWRCSNRKCPANAVASEQDDGKIIGKVRNTHTHLPQPEQRLAEIKRQELKQLIRDSPHLSRASIIASIRSGIDDETFVALGSDASLSHMAYSVRKCSGSATASEQEDGKIIGRVRNTHTHLPQPEKRLAEIKRQELKKLIKDSPHLSPASIIASIRSGIDDETFVALGTDASLMRMASREKAKLYGKGNSKVASSDFLSIQFPSTLIEKNGQSILLYDSRPVRIHDNKAVFVFAHPYMLSQLAAQPIWTIGSTFKSAPKPFKQCFIVGAFFRNQLIIAAHALLPEPSEQFYSEALEAISTAIEPAKPRKIITEFENEMVVAVQKVFPEATVSGCYFRYAQALFKKWCDLKLGTLYGHEKSLAGNIARMTFRRLLCLALIPPPIIARAFYIIESEAVQIPQLAAFLFYYKKTFIGLTDYEYRMKSSSYEIGDDSVFFSTVGHPMGYSDSNVSHEEHVYTAQPPHRYEMTDPSGSTIIVESANIDQIVHPPFCPIEFWNISDRASSALLQTNAAMEMAQLQIRQGPKQIPSLPDYILAFWDDFEKQRDTIRSVTISNIKNKKRNNRKYIIKEELVSSTLNEASYETDQAILNTLDMLSHHIQGYVNGLHFDIKNEKMMDESSFEFNESATSTNTSGGGGGGHLVMFDSPKPSTSNAFR